MLDGLKPYPEYKNTGDQWIGAVPVHWTVDRLKKCAFVNARTLPETTPPDYRFRYLDIGAVATGRLVRRPLPMKFEGAPSRARRIVRQGDTIISTVRTYLKAVYTVTADDTDLIASTGFAALTPKPNINAAYLSYAVQSDPFVNSVVAHSTGIAYPAIAETLLARLPLAYPPPPAEQAGIVRFLGAVDRKVNRFIRAKRRLIEVLTEQKQAIITHAVTKGLNPHAPLKPSGIDWLGDVPEHWEVKRLKWVVRLQRGYDLPADIRHSGGTVPVVSSGGIIDRHDVSMAHAPGIVIGRYGSTEAVFFLEEDYWPHNTALFTTTLHGNAARWCFYLLRTISKADHAGKSAVPGVDRKDLYDICVPRPPVAEQEQIVAAIDAGLVDIEAAIKVVLREIDLIREYRTRLVADVVTGKVDVRAAAASIPDEHSPSGGEDVAPAEGDDPAEAADGEGDDPAEHAPEEVEA